MTTKKKNQAATETKVINSVVSNAKRIVNELYKSPFTFVNVVNKNKEEFKELFALLGVKKLDFSAFLTLENGEATDRPTFAKLVEAKKIEIRELFPIWEKDTRTFSAIDWERAKVTINGKEFYKAPISFTKGDFMESIKSLIRVKNENTRVSKELEKVFNEEESKKELNKKVLNLAKDERYKGLPLHILEQIAKVA